MFGRLPRALPGNIATTANTATNKYLKHSIYTDLTMNLFLKPTKESCKAFTHWFILYINVFKRVLNVIALSFFSSSSSSAAADEEWDDDYDELLYSIYDDEMIYKLEVRV